MDTFHQLKLKNQLCFSLYTASREVIRLYKPLLDQYNLTYTQYLTMLVVWEHEKISVKNIGQELHLDSGTLTPVLKKLEAMDYVVKYRDKDDDRVVMIEASPHGKEMQKELAEVPKKILCHIDTDINELLDLKKQLDELITNLN